MLEETGPPAPQKRRRLGWILSVVLLSLALIATGVVLALALIRLTEANQRIEEQHELIEKKETFASAAENLMATAAQLDGLPYDSIVDTTRYTGIITRAWYHRWDGAALDRDTAALRTEAEELEGVVAAAQEEASTNATGTFFESLTDQLGAGYVRTSLDTADALCEADVLGCVTADEPFTIHYDSAETSGQPYMSDWLRSGLAYHEYAHVLQFANPAPTETAVGAFGGDWETMADCYALTMLPGWTLDHTIWVSDFEYWEISIGYGYTCDEAQRQVIREWVDSLGYTHAPISQ